ncbi:MAG: UvrD-helicase domain-containing protein, partial [Archangium sp.]|nr:UvrD-helicase domain-containing protein [Archangium sp.]
MILRREAENIGLNRSFLIYDDSDQMQLVRRAIREVGVDVSSVTPRDMLSRIDAEKNAGRMPGQAKPSPDPKAQTAQKVYRQYQKLLHAANAVDFGDLLLLLVELFRTNEEVRLRYQRRFEHVLVDEFQDTNPVQYELLKLLAPPPTSNVVVVGDDDQSIYRWRGAEVDNILGFPSVYPGCRVVKLEQNYRSDQVILEAAHAVIAQNSRRMPKKLWSSRARGEDLGLIIARDERGEAQQVAQRIHDLRHQGVCDYDQMAVFFRTNAQSRIIEETFRLNRVPYVLVSGRSFYDRAEIRDAASYLRLMVNPKSDADFLRVVNQPARGIGDTTEERVQDFAAEAGISLYEAIEVPARIASLNAGAVKRLAGFRALIDKLTAFMASQPDASKATEYMLNETGMVTAYMAEGTDEAMTRAENLRELLTATQEFDRQRAERLGAQTPQGEVKAPEPVPVEPEIPPKAQGDLFASFSASKPVVVETSAVEEQQSLDVVAPPLQAFLEQVSLVGEADGETGMGQNRVSVMTLHAAKGLEFDAVFLTGMEEEIFPHRRSTGPEAVPEEMAEERRLCYVGFTRARRRLTCSLAQSRALYGELRFNPPSRFLAEVPKELFGFADETERMPAAAPLSAAPMIRRRSFDDDGPVIDRSFDQSTDFHQSGDGEVKGMRVNHSQFGPGVVIDVAGKGPNAKLTVRFKEGVGVKTVIARFLTPA